jgi:hypothetical protein
LQPEKHTIRREKKPHALARACDMIDSIVFSDVPTTQAYKKQSIFMPAGPTKYCTIIDNVLTLPKVHTIIYNDECQALCKDFKVSFSEQGLPFIVIYCMIVIP